MHETSQNISQQIEETLTDPILKIKDQLEQGIDFPVEAITDDGLNVLIGLLGSFSGAANIKNNQAMDSPAVIKRTLGRLLLDASTAGLNQDFYLSDLYLNKFTTEHKDKHQDSGFGNVIFITLSGERLVTQYTPTDEKKTKRIRPGVVYALRSYNDGGYTFTRPHEVETIERGEALAISVFSNQYHRNLRRENLPA
jgi:hypothetical protein